MWMRGDCVARGVHRPARVESYDWTPMRIDGDTVNLHICIDHSIIDVFTGGPASLSWRTYPQSALSDGIGLFILCGHRRRLRQDG